jgi:hypothetical protein
MREHIAVAIWLAFLSVAGSLIALGLIAYTITVHADQDGFVEWHKVFYDQGVPATPQAPAPAAPIVHVTDDPGGNVGDYYRRYKVLSDSGTEIHFHGLCMSACTMVLFKDFAGIKACADEGATFGFHKPFALKDGKVLRTKRALKETRRLWLAWLEELPDPLRNYLRSARVPSATAGDEPNSLLLLPAKYLLPKCPMSLAAQ